MTETIFHYQSFLPVGMLDQDDHIVFATIFPDHERWLREHASAFHVSCYRWPELLSLLLHPRLGMTVCEVDVTVADEIAAQFAEAFPK